MMRTVDGIGNPASPASPKISIVICSDGRAAAFVNTLQCLQYLDGPDFEVVVVTGPTRDGTDEVVASWAGRIKTASNPVRNLSVSRNIGIRLASGDIIAFIDDDGLPEPAWLAQILGAFDGPKVGAVGGIVLDHTGTRPQHLYGACDRLGNPEWGRNTPAEDYNFPFSFNIPYVQGTNCAFRRTALLAIGGFDEEYEYYLDETDLCCRLVDAGWSVRQLSDAFVHHKFLPSAIRNVDRITRVMYPVLKNKLYYSLVNNLGHCPLRRTIEDMLAFVALHEGVLRDHVAQGRLAPDDLDAFQADVDRAWSIGLARGMSRRRRLLAPDAPLARREDWKVFPRPRPEGGRKVFVFCSREYPPGRFGGVGRYTHQLARAIAAIGHHVHVLTVGEGHDRIDFEDGVWVHRIASRASAPQPPGFAVPGGTWDYGTTLLETVRGLRGDPVTAVCTPIWDCEGIAFMADGSFPHVLVLQTPLRAWLENHPHMLEDQRFMAEHGTPILRAEKQLLEGSDRVISISRTIGEEIARSYEVTLDSRRTDVIHLGSEDWVGLPVVAPPALPEGAFRLLFVGRLERRKGVDVLLAVAKRFLCRHPCVHLDLVGNDTIPAADGITYRQAFEADPDSAAVIARVHFHGEVSDQALRGFYRACDVLVTPSRYESFGLMLVEGMMFAKPVVGCRAGGMVEVVEAGVSGLLAEPGDEASLEACLERLVSDEGLRRDLGAAGRARFEEHFSAARVARDVVASLYRAAEDHARRQHTGAAA